MITVVLAEDETLIRQALTSLLSLEDDIEVVATAASGGEALDTIRHHRPDVALLDLQMPEPNGIAVAAELRQEMPDCGCVIVTSHGRPGYLRTALASGVRGFVPKTVGAAVLAQVVRTVADGGRYVDPELAAEAMAAGDSPLTAREADVLALAFEGSPVDEIASRAGLSAGTVRNYLSASVAKLGAANRHEAARVARERGWI